MCSKPINRLDHFRSVFSFLYVLYATTNTDRYDIDCKVVIGESLDQICLNALYKHLLRKRYDTEV